jgi:hypothetical protein
MNTAEDNRNKATRRMRWVARIWSIPIIVYALIMFVGYTWSWITTGVADPYAVEDVSPVEALPPILLFLSIVGLGIAWRWERLGGTIALLFLLGTVLVLLFQTPIARNFPASAIPYLLSLIVAIPAVLFVVCGWRGSQS